MCHCSMLQDELTASELVFSGILEGLTPAEAVALVSALVFQARVGMSPLFYLSSPYR